MPTISQTTVLRDVEHILGSGTGVLDFAIAGESQYRTWWGGEEAEWTIDDVGRVENADEDRLLIYPEGDSFVCEIEAQGEEGNAGPVHCYCE